MMIANCTTATSSFPHFSASPELVVVKAAAEDRRQTLLVLSASSEREIETAFATMHERQPGALFMGADVFFAARRDLIVELAARYAVPTIYVSVSSPKPAV
jgi:hypothetical protein